MEGEQLDVEVTHRRPYPWFQVLLVVLVYVGLIALLWYFPVPSVQVFFRNLLKGFGYLLAGLVLVVITAFVIYLIPPPWAARSVEEPTEEADEERSFAGCVVPGRVMLVPALRSDSQADEVLEVLFDALDELASEDWVAVDLQANAIAVMGSDDEEVDKTLHEISARLREAGFRLKRP
ncbi:MAG: hypothetical protein ACP5HS_08615 [Anaerolineae bacterium]